MSGIVGSKFNHRGSGLVGSLGTDGQHMLSAGPGKSNVFETVSAGGNTPIIHVMKSANQSHSDDVMTKVTWDTEHVDTDGTFASDRFTPAVAGKYFIIVNILGRSDSTYKIIEVQAAIYKNGGTLVVGLLDQSSGTSLYSQNMRVCAVADLDDDDYIEVYSKLNVSSGTPSFEGTTTHGSTFTAFKIG